MGAPSQLRRKKSSDASILGWRDNMESKKEQAFNHSLTKNLVQASNEFEYHCDPYLVWHSLGIRFAQ
jgi:hypothetical protein